MTGSTVPGAGAITDRERMAVVLSRQLVDGWTVGVGARSTLPTAAAMLARAGRAPNLTLLSGGIYVNPRRLVPFTAGHDPQADATGDFVDVYQLTEQGVDAICYSGMQVDRHGSINLHWIDRPEGRFRGPGIANTSFGHTAGRTLLWVERHDRRTLVGEVDFASVVGLARRGRSRAELGLPNLGPALLLTPSVLFVAAGGVLAPHSWHAATSWDEVRAATGWELPVAPPPRTPEPDDDEIALLRGAVDPGGLLRG